MGTPLGDTSRAVIDSQPQPLVLLNRGSQVCGRYLGETLQPPLESALCPAQPQQRVTCTATKMHAWLCCPHFDELMTEHPEWVSVVGGE